MTLFATLAFILCAFIIYVYANNSGFLKADIANGKLVITDKQLESHKGISLDGEWLLYEDALLTPEQAKNSVQSSKIIHMPHMWNEANDLLAEHYNLSYATYVINIRLEKNDGSLSLRFPEIGSAYKAFINQTEIASGGVVSNSRETIEAGFNPGLFLIPENLLDLQLLLQVANHNYGWGGTWSPILLGKTTELFANETKSIAFSMFIVGALIITAIFHLTKYLLIPQRMASLTFTFLCLILAIRVMTHEHMLFLLKNLEFESIIRMDYLTFSIAMPIGLLFFHQYYRHELNILATKVFYAVSLIAVLLFAVFPVATFDWFLIPTQVLAITIMLFVMLRIIVARRNKRTGANVILFGIIILTLFGINDVLYTNNFIDTKEIMSFSLLLFIICQNYLINKETVEAIESKQTLALKLDINNKELKELSSNLELTVEKRTQELLDVNAKLETLSTQDSLTGLLNRRGFLPFVKAAANNLARYQENFCILLIDIDDFKKVNDTYGHHVGDQVIEATASSISNASRDSDSAARWGGEEFCVLLPKTEMLGAFTVAEKIRKSIESQKLSIDYDELKFTISVGASMARLNEKIEDVIKRADEALYDAKQSGKNRVSQ